MAPTSIALVRSGAALPPQSVWLDFTPAGAAAIYGERGAPVGASSAADGVALYCPPETDLVIGDVFRNGAAQYTVEFVSPAGWTAPDGAEGAIVLAWARAMRSRGA